MPAWSGVSPPTPPSARHAVRSPEEASLLAAAARSCLAAVSKETARRREHHACLSAALMRAPGPRHPLSAWEPTGRHCDGTEALLAALSAQLVRAASRTPAACGSTPGVACRSGCGAAPAAWTRKGSLPCWARARRPALGPLTQRTAKPNLRAAHSTARRAWFR